MIRGEVLAFVMYGSGIIVNSDSVSLGYFCNSV